MSDTESGGGEEEDALGLPADRLGLGGPEFGPSGQKHGVRNPPAFSTMTTLSSLFTTLAI